MVVASMVIDMFLGVGSRLTGRDRLNDRSRAEYPSNQTTDHVPFKTLHHATYCMVDPCGAAEKAA